MLRKRLFLVLAGSLMVALSQQPGVFKVRMKQDLLFATPHGIELRLDLHLPEGVENPPLVMFIHGGGWTSGDRKRLQLPWVAQYGYAVASVEYRLSHEALFPAQIHDCKGALRWLRAHQAEHGYDASRVVVAGMSAGGYLAALMGSTGGIAEFEGTTAGHPDESSEVQGVIDYFGPTDFVLRSKSQPQITDEPGGFVRQLLGRPVTGNEDFARLASPVTHVGPGDPPILIIHGELDRQVLPDQSLGLFESCKANGIEAQLHTEPGKGHGWSPPTQQERKLVLDFLNKQLRRN